MAHSLNGGVFQIDWQKFSNCGGRGIRIKLFAMPLSKRGGVL